MNKKKLLALAVAVIMIAILSFSTLAWYNDSESVSNEFFVADSNITSPDEIFSVDVYEEVDTDGDGVADKKEEVGQQYKDVVPGQTLSKVATVENTGKFGQWVELTLTFSSTTAWDVLMDGTVTEPTGLLTLDPNFATDWELASAATENGAYVYKYYLKASLASGASVTPFTAVNIPTTLEQADFFSIKDEQIKLDVKAVAVQLELGATAAEAFAAYYGSVNP